MAYQSATLQIFGMLGGQIDTVFRIKMCTAFDYVAALKLSVEKLTWEDLQVMLSRGGKKKKASCSQIVFM